MKPRERRLLRFVQSFKAAHGNEPPALADVAAAVGIRNTAKVRRLVGTLIDRGQMATQTVVEEDGGFVPPARGGGGGGEQN